MRDTDVVAVQAKVGPPAGWWDSRAAAGQSLAAAPLHLVCACSPRTANAVACVCFRALEWNPRSTPFCLPAGAQELPGRRHHVQDRVQPREGLLSYLRHLLYARGLRDS